MTSVLWPLLALVALLALPMSFVFQGWWTGPVVVCWWVVMAWAAGRALDRMENR